MNCETCSAISLTNVFEMYLGLSQSLRADTSVKYAGISDLCRHVGQIIKHVSTRSDGLGAWS